jgi:hypothetical protein
MSKRKAARSPDIVTIFKLSPVNGGHYNGDLLPPQRWNWPRSTWLKRRMAQIDEFRVGSAPRAGTDAISETSRTSPG